MIRTVMAAFAALLFLTSAAVAQDKAIKSAMSAGPPSISADATILDWQMNVLREGTNEWVCLPDRPDTDGTDPWCIEGPWMSFLQAFVSGEEPEIDRIGFAYMLQGDAAVSNADPMATEPTGEDDWVTGIGGHMMIIVPDPAMLEGISTDHRNGGPWVMWPNTPYAHIMAPTEDRWAGMKKGR
jgi:hypothetical protein